MPVRVSLLYVDDCPSWQVTGSRLAEALLLVGLPDQVVEHLLIATEADAQAAHFRGSPTILIDGEDPFDDGGTRSFGLTCRLFPTDAGLAGSPTVDQLVAALAVRGGVPKALAPAAPEPAHGQHRTVAVVREWHDDEGWGVLDSDETPGGCWAHFSSLSIAGFRHASPGQRVSITYHHSPQDGFDYVADDVTIDGIPRVESESRPPGPGYFSRLTIGSD